MKKRVSLFDWQFKLGVFFLILTLIILIITLVLFATAKFVDNFGNYLGNGFWALNHYGLKDLLFNWVQLDDDMIHLAYLSHNFLQEFIAIIFLLFVLPVFFIAAVTLTLHWWIKTRI
ncbi:MAG: hypothetical protein REH79_03560 [Spiroplasma sp.]|nr:hypothetical protein [Spiroplasma sp.]